MNIINKTATLAATAATALALSAGTDFYVAPAPKGSDGNPGTAEAPFAKIATALARVTATGGTIHLAPGDYNEWGLVIDQAIRIVGEGASREETVIYGFDSPYSSTGRRIFHITADATIENLTIKNGGFTTDGTAANGGNVFMSAGTIRNCVIEGGYVQHTRDAPSLAGALGGNIFMTGGLVVDCEIKDGGIYNSNGAGGGGNVMMYGGGRLMRCRVTGGRRTKGTTASYTTNSGGGGIYMNGAATVENCFIGGNSGSYGAVSMIGAARLVNCTIAGNSGGYNNFNGVVLRNGDPCVVNCVIADNGGSAVNEWGNANAGRFINCALFLEIAGSTDCVVMEKDLATTFADTVSYRPTANAEFRDKGSAEQYASLAQSGTDLDGRMRSTGGCIDVGAYEYDPNAISVSSDRAITGQVLAFTTEVMEPDLTYVWDFGNGVTRTATEKTTRYAYSYAGVFPVKLVISQGGTPIGEVPLLGEIVVKPSRIYVDATNESPAAPYDTEESACTSLADAIRSVCDVLVEGITVVVAPGTYDEANIVLDRRITVLGGGATRDDVVIRANPEPCGATGRRVFSLQGSATVANLTICNGSWETTGADENGGNVFMSAGTVSNCVIRGGYVKHTKDASIAGALGGNVYMRGGQVVDSVITEGTISNVSGAGGGGNVMMYGGGARLVRCRITDAKRTGASAASHSTASGGSGVYMNGDTTMENCLVARNAGSCGAVSMIGAAKAVNCTIVGNAGNYNGYNGIYLRDANPLVANTVVFGDATAAGSWGGSYGNRFLNSAANAEIVGGTECRLLSGEFSSFFADEVDYRPVGGALLDKGSNDLYGQYAQSETDLGLAPRIVDTVDIGCYETAAGGFSCLGNVSAQGARRGQSLVFAAEASGADEVEFTWDFGNGETLTTSDTSISHAFPTCGVFTVVLTADGGAKGTASFTLRPIVIVPGDVYVNAASISPEAPYDASERAATSIAMAMSALKDEFGGLLADDVVVHVASGTYTESGITADRPIRIVGEGSNRKDVVVRANESPRVGGAGRVFTLLGGGAILNMTVSNGCYTTVIVTGATGNDINGGNVYMGAGGLVSNCVIAAGHVNHTVDGALHGVMGGNLYLADASAVDCDIRDGSVYNSGGAAGGGNVAMTGESRLVRCRVTGGHRNAGQPSDYAKESGGSGICAVGAAVIENCLIENNSGCYGAVALKNGAQIVQSTVVRNSSNYQGYDGVVLCSDDCQALNTAMYNTAANAVAEWGDMRGAKFTNCASPVAIADGVDCVTLAGTLESQFANRIRYVPATGSALCDAGKKYLGEDRDAYGVDFRHRPRFKGKAPDIGCCEVVGGLVLMLK